MAFNGYNDISHQDITRDGKGPAGPEVTVRKVAETAPIKASFFHPSS